MELIYCSPLTMKKLFSFFIGQSETIQCKFKKNQINMLCKDKYSNNKIRITMNSKKMHRYYCNNEYRLQYCFQKRVLFRNMPNSRLIIDSLI